MSLSQRAKGCILILGAEGMLGRDLTNLFRRVAEDDAAWRVVAWDIGELDIRDEARVLAELGALKPGIVINAAACTDVDGCESDVEPALAVNTEGPGHIARACSDIGATLVHFGTDFIFDGSAEQP